MPSSRFTRTSWLQTGAYYKPWGGRGCSPKWPSP